MEEILIKKWKWKIEFIGNGPGPQWEKKK